MATQIHTTAIIEKGAELDDDVVIGPYAYVGPHVHLGRGTCVQHHATVDGFTTLGNFNEIFPYALIGGKTQDLKYKGGKPGLAVGNHNIFREYVTIHCATSDGCFTQVGDHNLILAYSHVAHDCVMGNNIIMSSQTVLAGHVVIEDFANISGHCAVHQFCRVGQHALLAASSLLTQDLPPYMLAEGTPARVQTINKVGLERRGFSEEEREFIRKVYKTLYRSGLNRSQALDSLRALPCEGNKNILDTLFRFSAQSQRGFA